VIHKSMQFVTARSHVDHRSNDNELCHASVFVDSTMHELLLLL